jgi:hypothetical protein
MKLVGVLAERVKIKPPQVVIRPVFGLDQLVAVKPPALALRTFFNFNPPEINRL